MMQTYAGESLFDVHAVRARLALRSDAASGGPHHTYATLRQYPNRVRRNAAVGDTLSINRRFWRHSGRPRRFKMGVFSKSVTLKICRIW